MRFNIALLLLMWACSDDLLAQEGYYLNPGIKFGHTFGENGGVTMGVEISYTKVGDGELYGILASIDYCREARRVRYHVGGEYFAVALGPTLIVENGVVDWGINVTPCFGVVVIPYFNYTYRFKETNLFEVGGFLKLPIHVAGREFSIGH